MRMEVLQAILSELPECSKGYTRRLPAIRLAYQVEHQAWTIIALLGDTKKMALEYTLGLPLDWTLLLTKGQLLGSTKDAHILDHPGSMGWPKRVSAMPITYSRA
jgi:hypothetical protein